MRPVPYLGRSDQLLDDTQSLWCSWSCSATTTTAIAATTSASQEPRRWTHEPVVDSNVVDLGVAFVGNRASNAGTLEICQYPGAVQRSASSVLAGRGGYQSIQPSVPCIHVQVVPSTDDALEFDVYPFMSRIPDLKGVTVACSVALIRISVAELIDTSTTRNRA